MHVEVCTTASAAWAVRCYLTTLSKKTTDSAKKSYDEVTAAMATTMAEG